MTPVAGSARPAAARRVIGAAARTSTAVALAALALVGCGGDAGSTATAAAGPAPSLVELAGVEMAFRPDVLHVASGGTISYVNEGVVRHDLRVQGKPRFFAEVAPGATVAVVVDLAKGRYELFCSLPGHREAGMTGTLIVG